MNATVSINDVKTDCARRSTSFAFKRVKKSASSASSASSAASAANSIVSEQSVLPVDSLEKVKAIVASKTTANYGYHLCHITSEEAKEMLKRNIGNRQMKKSNLKRIIESIVNGKYTPNPSPIVFDENMILVDGQTRLTAVSLVPGAMIPCIIVVGFPRKYMKNVDTDAIRRSIFDRMTIDGYKVTCQAVKICNAMINPKGSNSPSVDLAEKMFDKYGPSIVWTDEHRGDLATSVLGVVARAHAIGYSTERLRVFLALMNGEQNMMLNNVDWRDLMVIRFSAWYSKHGKSNPVHRAEIRAYCEFVLAKYLYANQTDSEIKAADKELFPLPTDGNL
jgi:hypothetical protein